MIQLHEINGMINTNKPIKLCFYYMMMNYYFATENLKLTSLFFVVFHVFRDLFFQHHVSSLPLRTVSYTDVDFFHVYILLNNQLKLVVHISKNQYRLNQISKIFFFKLSRKHNEPSGTCSTLVVNTVSAMVADTSLL